MPHPFSLFLWATPRLAVMVVSSDQPIVEVGHQEGGVVTLSHCLSNLRDVSITTVTHAFNDRSSTAFF